MSNRNSRLSGFKKLGYMLLGLLTLAVLVMSFVQLWFLYAVGDVSAYGVLPSDEQGQPTGDSRGVFLMLTDRADRPFHGNLVGLLATTEPGVVDPEQGIHLRPEDLKAVLVRSSVIGEPSDYRVYRLTDQSTEKLSYSKQSDGRSLLITASDGAWDPGNYIVDVPSEGMYGGRTYYQFYIDPPGKR
jgi:hypothetical protein